MPPLDAALLWQELCRPLLRLLLGLSAGLLLAQILEACNWTRHLARLAGPLARIAHLREVAGAAFSLSFVSPAAANSLLSTSHAQGEIRERELMLANIFNSLPAFLVHAPGIFFLIWPVLGAPALAYLGLSLLAAAGRTVLAVGLARWLLPAPPPGCAVCNRASPDGQNWRTGLGKAWRRFRLRLKQMLLFSVPVYIAMFFLQHYGFFVLAEQWLAGHVSWLGFLRPEALGIIALHLVAELGAALGAAGSAFQAGGLSAEEIILALMVGNILSTPMRAIRHQYPAYTGFYRPGLAGRQHGGGRPCLLSLCLALKRGGAAMTNAEHSRQGAQVTVLLQPEERRFSLPRPKTARQLLQALGLGEECALVARNGELLTPDRRIWPDDELLVRKVASSG